MRALTSHLSMLSALVLAAARSQLQYRTSFIALTLSQMMFTLVEFVEISLLFSAARGTFGGLNWSQGLLVFGMAGIAFGLADVFFGEIEQLGSLINQGKLETYLVRPIPLLLSLMTYDLQLRRLGRAATGLIAYVAALIITGVHWTPTSIATAILAPLLGTALFAGFFVISGALQFYVLDGKQAGNAVVYGGRFASSMPAGALNEPLRMLFTYIVPSTAIAYIPTCILLGLPLPPLLPTWAVWWPLIAVIGWWSLTMLVWRNGIRRYIGAGG